jgi:hypothetical protein
MWWRPSRRDGTATSPSMTCGTTDEQSSYVKPIGPRTTLLWVRVDETMTPLSKYQLERADLLTTIEQGRRVENELFAENSRGLRTMGELLKARLFGSTAWAINLRKRMTNYVGQGPIVSTGGNTVAPRPKSLPHTDVQGGGATADVAKSVTTPLNPHQWPCGDPYCQLCDDAVKRLLRGLGVLPRKGGTR